MGLAPPLALLLLVAVAADEGRGMPGATPEEALALRGSARLRLGVGGGVLFGLARYSPWGLGVGLTADLGVVFADRLSLFLHAEFGTAVTTVIGSGALVVEYALSDLWAVGVGAAFTAAGPLRLGDSSLLRPRSRAAVDRR